MSYKKLLVLVLAGTVGFGVLSGCASSAMKQRKEQQTKLSQSSKLYCEFINGAIFHDVDVALNVEMAKRCDSDKPYTITQYKTVTEDNGILYCCTLTSRPAVAMGVIEKSDKKSDAKKTNDKPADGKDDELE